MIFFWEVVFAILGLWLMAWGFRQFATWALEAEHLAQKRNQQSRGA